MLLLLAFSLLSFSIHGGAAHNLPARITREVGVDEFHFDGILKKRTLYRADWSHNKKGFWIEAARKTDVYGNEKFIAYKGDGRKPEPPTCMDLPQAQNLFFALEEMYEAQKTSYRK